MEEDKKKILEHILNANGNIKVEGESLSIEEQERILNILLEHRELNEEALKELLGDIGKSNVK